MCSELHPEIFRKMNYKSKLLFFLLFLATSVLNAQKITIEGGYFNPKRLGDITSKTYFDGVRVGAMAEWELKNKFGIQTGLLYYNAYSHKVQKYPSADSVVYNTWTHGFEIPVRLTYQLKLFKDFHVFGYAGPDFQLGLAQNQWMTSTLESNWANFTGIKPTGDVLKLYPDKISPLNIQLGAGGGVQWRKFILKSGYDFGLNNLYKTGTDYVTQGQWHVSFAYQIK